MTKNEVAGHQWLVWPLLNEQTQSRTTFPLDPSGHHLCPFTIEISQWVAAAE